MNKFEIGYMNNPGLYVNKAFRDQVGKYMNITFGELTHYFIKGTLSKNNTSVLALMMFHEKIA